MGGEKSRRGEGGVTRKGGLLGFFMGPTQHPVKVEVRGAVKKLHKILGTLSIVLEEL